MIEIGSGRPQTDEGGSGLLCADGQTVGQWPFSVESQQILQAYKEQHGVEQNFAFLKDPAIINAIFLKKEECIEALGLVLLLALLITRLAERDSSQYTQPHGSVLTGWDKKKDSKSHPVHAHDQIPQGASSENRRTPPVLPSSEGGMAGMASRSEFR